MSACPSRVRVVGGVTTGERPLGVEQSFRTLAPSGEPWTSKRAVDAPSRRVGRNRRRGVSVLEARLCRPWLGLSDRWCN